MASGSGDIERQWDKVLIEAGLEAAELLVSSYDPGRRVYADGNRIYKVVLLCHETTGALRRHGPSGEYKILCLCRGVQGIPEAIEYRKGNGFEVLVMERKSGIQLDKSGAGLLRHLSIALRLSIVAFRLARRSVSHNDIKSENILVEDDGRIALIDFDQATETVFLHSIIRAFTGIQVGGNEVHGSIKTIAKDYIKQKLSPGMVEALKKIIGRDDEKMHRLPEIPENAPQNIKTLLNAWLLAQSSDASSPGKRVAYYSYEADGLRFPGERSWSDRWKVLSSITDYSGKRILELGCNMGLLSCSLLKEKAASTVLGVDHDATILKSAELIARFFDVKPSFRQQDLDATADWESVFTEFKPDIVFALNVLNWVKNKERLLSFLGCFEEVIFEGHDSVEVESHRLKGVGFTDIRLVSTSERKRPILHCRKNSI